MAAEGDVYQHQDVLEPGNHSDHSLLEETNGEGMFQQNALQEGETHVEDYGMSGQRVELDVQRTLTQIMKEAHLDDDEMDAGMAAAEKELAEAEDHRIRQHEELVLLRQQLAEVILQNKKDEEWNNIMEAKVGEVEADFQHLDQQCDNLTRARIKYVDERCKLCKYSELMNGIVERARQDVETFKSQGQREIDDLKRSLEEEQTKTEALLNENDDSDEFRGLQQEIDQRDKEILDLQIKLNVEMARVEETLERLSSVKKEIAKAEDISKQLDELEAEVKRMEQEREGKDAFLNAELARKDETVIRSTLEKIRLQAVTARYNSLMKERDERRRKFGIEKTAALKELEEDIKELVVIQNKNAIEIGAMLKKRGDLVESVRLKENKLREVRKSKEASRESVSLLEREISELNQDSLLKQGKIDSLKLTLTQLENDLRKSNDLLENLRRNMEQKRNEDAYAGLCHDDELVIESVKIQDFLSLLQESDDVIASREFQRNMLQGEWDSLFDTITSIHEEFSSRINTLHSSKSDDVWLEEMKKTIQSEVSALTETCSRVRCKRDDLRCQIEDMKAALQDSEAAAESAKQEEQSVESNLQSLRSSLATTQKMNEDLKLKTEEKKETISSLKESEANLKKEIESLLTTGASHSKSVLMKELEDTDKQIEEKSLNLDRLKSATSELEKKMMEEQERGERAVKAKQEEIAVLDKHGAEKEEEIRQATEKMDKWRAMIQSNKEKRASRVKRSEEVQENLTVMEKEVSELEEKLQQQKNEAAEKEKLGKARLEALQKQITTLKRNAEDKEKAFILEKGALTEQIKKSQTTMKTLHNKIAKPETDTGKKMKAPSQGGWLSQVRSGQSGNSQSDTNTLGVTQPDPRPYQGSSRFDQPNRKRERSPSSDSVSSIELSMEDMAAVRAGQLNVWHLAAKQSQESKARKKEKNLSASSK